MDPLSGLSVFLGAFTALLLLSMRVFPRRWARLFADAGRERGRPAWAWACLALSMAGIVVFWLLHFLGDGDLSLAMAVLGTFLMARTVQALTVKAGLRENARTIMAGKAGPAFLAYTAVSILLVVLGLF
jgi:hypothetical protein